ncbi:MAG: hypothetical protein JXA89_16980 [Anaerolineae bacterium]|nr:hypothetical protein [Anaerolineae bacterium]
MLCIWAAGLAIEILFRAFLLSIKQAEDGTLNFLLTVPAVAVTTAYVSALIVAIVGLARLRNWGRKLFLGLITAYYGLLFVGSLPVWGPLVGIPLFSPGQAWVTAVVLESSIGLAFGWWYLYRRRVKRWFGVEP